MCSIILSFYYRYLAEILNTTIKQIVVFLPLGIFIQHEPADKNKSNITE